MLNQFKLQAQDLKIECEEFSQKEYLKTKDFDGDQGLFSNYDEYVNTVNLLNALSSGNQERFKSLMDKMALNSEYTINVTFGYGPRNPYSHMQTRNGSQNKTLLEIAEEYNQLDFITLLEEQYAPCSGRPKNKI